MFVMACCASVFAQADGYWDKERATTKEITLSAGDKGILMTDDLPIGTTEVIYRITLLDDNQQLASSLVSILKSIPDPTGISQGSAGAVFIMSKISGSDQCKYAVFSTAALGQLYKKEGKTTDACVYQEVPVSKDARRLSVDQSTCLAATTRNIWFGFESTNWIMKQKIVLEVVPWVDVKLSRGWTVANRKYIINQCKTSALAQKMANPDEFCICVEEKIQKNYKFSEFQKLLSIEQAKVYKDNGNFCYADLDGATAIITRARTQAASFIKKGDYSNAIAQLTTVLSSEKATASDFNGMGYSYLMTKQFAKAIRYFKMAEQLDDTDLLVKINLAHAYLFNDDFKSAKAIYKEYQAQNVSDSLSWKQKVTEDFAFFTTKGFSNTDFDRVLKMF
jgi:tetratricopeptide (TPR) repeat protein